nr:MAG TPA: alpha glucosidase-like protein [Caudoviricetes sp.]
MFFVHDVVMHLFTTCIQSNFCIKNRSPFFELL